MTSLKAQERAFISGLVMLKATNDCILEHQTSGRFAYQIKQPVHNNAPVLSFGRDFNQLPAQSAST